MDNADGADVLAYRELCVTTTLASEEEVLGHLVLPTGAPPPAPGAGTTVTT